MGRPAVAVALRPAPVRLRTSLTSASPPRAHTCQESAHLTHSPGRPPLLHLPLSFPSSSTAAAPVLTAWSHVSLSLPQLLAHFSSPLLASPPPPGRRAAQLPDARAARGASWTHVKVFANCRLRRVWFSAARAVGAGPERGSEELALFASEAPAEAEREADDP